MDNWGVYSINLVVFGWDYYVLSLVSWSLVFICSGLGLGDF